MEYKDYNDYELLNYVSENNEEANEILFEKYRPLIVKTSTDLYKHCKNRGLELNDLIQEGMLAFNLALKSYDQDKEASFPTYAKKCVQRRIISLVVSTYRLKHKTLNESISFQIGEEDNFEHSVEDNSYNPEELMINTETEREIIKQAHEVLTEFESQVFDLRVSGFNYKEIAAILDKDKKSIDNAIQRIKNKVKDKITN
ncbi:MAG: sigma-70 family RNA polymerase sigma factor [Clostridium sp.]|nr:sigma-70 family RNA polymerase sigma factor [Clostridium sp.]MCM1444678.1 sigma-70 family RNA polymerase sigma factor [Candidatus Amulumruptor caecigallinarius]